MISVVFITGCFGMQSRKPKYIVIDSETVPMQIVDKDSNATVVCEFVNGETGEVTKKDLIIKDYQGWYILRASTYKKLVESGIKQVVKVIILSPESDPFRFADDSEITIKVRRFDEQSNEDVESEIKIKDYKGWIVIHPMTYKRIIKAGINNTK